MLKVMSLLKLQLDFYQMKFGESLKIIVHKRKCASAQNCKITMLENSTISNELRSTILRTAAKLEKQSKKEKIILNGKSKFSSY